MTRARLLFSSIVLALAALGDAPPASASHYRFDRVELVTAAEARALRQNGIHDTRELLHWTARRRNRAWLAEASAIPYERLTALATQCDLLRIDGIGPTMVDALQKAAVIDTTELAYASPTALLERLRIVTRGTPMRQRLPDEDTLAVWIRDARRLAPVLEDVPRPDAGR